jgi:hypothetical protein
MAEIKERLRYLQISVKYPKNTVAELNTNGSLLVRF